MTTTPFQIGHLLDKMTSSDKDFRFMATNDLMGELQKDSIKLDDDSERKVVKMLLKLLSDKNGEVQNLAVKCMGPLVKKVKDVQVELIVDSLCNNMTSSDEQLRDISSIGLKTVIADLPITSNNIAGNVCRRITTRLSEAIEKQEDVSVLLEALDIISDLLSRFGGVLTNYHGEVLSALVPQLKSTRQAVRKRTIVALGYLVLNCNDTLYTTLINQLTGVLKSVDGSDDVKYGAVYCTYIQCIAAVCRQSGHRFGKYVADIVPLIIKFSQEDDDELREYCLQAFEAVVRRCPQEVEMFTEEIITICLNYMKYDPNYTDDDGAEDDCMMDTDEERIFDDDDDDDDDYSDDDDMSWKVRRSAAKCLEAVISTRRDLLCTLLTTVSPALITRFKEREENVKSDIFNAYIALLKQVKIAASSNVDIDQMEEGETPVSLLQTQVPAIIRAVHIQLREKSIKTRQVCLILLKELLSAIPGTLADFIPLLMPGIQFCLSTGRYSSSNMRIDTLSFVACLLSSHPPELFHPYLSVILPLITTAVGDNFYKITAEALSVLEELVMVIRPLDRECNFDFTPYVRDVYECTLLRLQTSDIDQEVKEKAISCMGQIVANLGDRLKSEENVFLTLFIERLQNEIMRLTTVKALTKIAASPLRIDLRPVLEFGTPVLATFLRKNHRALKLSTLTLLDTLVLNYSDSLEPFMLHPIVAELPLLISDSDLHVAQLTLTLLTNIIELHPQSIEDMSVILRATIALVKSALLQGGALTAVLQFFRSLVGANIPGYGYQKLLDNLIGTVKETTGKSSTNALHKQAVHSMAKCVAALAVTKPDNAVYLAKMFLGDLPLTRKNDVGGMFALLIIGEIGRYIDLSAAIDVKDSVLACFQHQSEEIKSAASYALGSLAIGNMHQYLPFILHEIRVQPKRLYLLLHSLKEVILYLSSSEEGVKQLEPFVPLIWERLFGHCECQEEGTRNVVAECLGKLTLINPSVLLPQLQSCLASNSPFMRATVLTAFKSTISDHPQAIDSLLKQTIGNFLKCLEDPDLNVRKMTLMAFNSAAHNKPMLIRDLLDVTLPKLYAETIVKEELIHEVEMGPFRHKVDDGLDLRKVAFECMYTLLDTCLDKFDIFEFLSHLELGLKDHYDIKMLTYLMVTRLAQLSPSAVLLRIDKLVEPLRLVCTSKVKANSVKQEYEKQDELKNSAIRTFTALLCIPDADKSSAVTDFLQHITSNKELKLIFETIQKDALLRLKHDDNLMDIS